MRAAVHVLICTKFSITYKLSITNEHANETGKAEGGPRPVNLVGPNPRPRYPDAFFNRT